MDPYKVAGSQLEPPGGGAVPGVPNGVAPDALIRAALALALAVAVGFIDLWSHAEITDSASLWTVPVAGVGMGLILKGSGGFGRPMPPLLAAMTALLGSIFACNELCVLAWPLVFGLVFAGTRQWRGSPGAQVERAALAAVRVPGDRNRSLELGLMGLSVGLGALALLGVAVFSFSVQMFVYSAYTEGLSGMTLYFGVKLLPVVVATPVFGAGAIGLVQRATWARAAAGWALGLVWLVWPLGPVAATWGLVVLGSDEAERLTGLGYKPLLDEPAPAATEWMAGGAAVLVGGATWLWVSLWLVLTAVF